MPAPETIVTGSLLGRAEAYLAESNKPEDKSTLGKDDFLTLLVAQLTYQDPLNPMEDKEFTGQMAQFSSLEQLTNINEGIESLNSSSGRNQMTEAVNFIGKSVRANGYNLSKDDGAISKTFYSLGETVFNAYANIYDSAGQLVRTMELGSKQPGDYQLEWDGKDWGGKELPDGTYSVAIAAEGADGQPVYVQTDVSGRVSGVVQEAGQYYLRLDDGRYLNFLNVKEVVEPATVADTGDGTGDQS